MSANNETATSDEIAELAIQFPALHEPSDCIATVRRMMTIFGNIIYGRDTVDECRFPGACAPKTRTHAESDAPYRAEVFAAVFQYLANEIVALQARGYTVEEAVQHLGESLFEKNNANHPVP